MSVFKKQERFKLMWVEQDKKCYYCYKSILFDEISVDHKLPKSKGGKNSMENYAVCCFNCNNDKADMTEEEYTKKRAYWKLGIKLGLKKNDEKKPERDEYINFLKRNCLY